MLETVVAAIAATGGRNSVSREEKLNPPTQEDESPEDLHLQVDLRLKLDEIADFEAELLRVKSRRAPTRSELCQLACRIYDARRARDKVFERKLFGEPAWDILLALYCLPARGEILGTSSLSLCAGIPPTTGLRWEAELRKQGLIERGPHVSDKRRQLVRLTPMGKALLESYLTRLFYVSTPIPPHPEKAGG